MKINSIQSGISVVELIVAITLIALSVPVIAGMINALTQLNDRAYDMTTINALVENKVESLRSKGYAGISSGTVDFSSELPATIAAPRSASYTVSDSASGPSLKAINITISYNDYGSTRQLAYKTYLGELGVGQY